MLFFRLSTWLLFVLLAVVIFGATAIGWLIGKRVRHKSDDLREPFSLMQGALLGFMGLVLAFGLSLAVGRYEARRAAVVDEANSIGTTYLRAQTIAEPQRSQSLALLRRFADTSISISDSIPGSAKQNRELTVSEQLQRKLWAMAGEALTMPRLIPHPGSTSTASTRCSTRSPPGSPAWATECPHPCWSLRSSGRLSLSPHWPCTWPLSAAEAYSPR